MGEFINVHVFHNEVVYVECKLFYIDFVISIFLFVEIILIMVVYLLYYVNLWFCFFVVSDKIFYVFNEQLFCIKYNLCDEIVVEKLFLDLEVRENFCFVTDKIVWIVLIFVDFLDEQETPEKTKALKGKQMLLVKWNIRVLLEQYLDILNTVYLLVVGVKFVVVQLIAEHLYFFLLLKFIAVGLIIDECINIFVEIHNILVILIIYADK